MHVRECRQSGGHRRTGREHRSQSHLSAWRGVAVCQGFAAPPVFAEFPSQDFKSLSHAPPSAFGFLTGVSHPFRSADRGAVARTAGRTGSPRIESFGLDRQVRRVDGVGSSAAEQRDGAIGIAGGLGPVGGASRSKRTADRYDVVGMCRSVRGEAGQAVVRAAGGHQKPIERRVALGLRAIYGDIRRADLNNECTAVAVNMAIRPRGPEASRGLRDDSWRTSTAGGGLERSLGEALLPRGTQRGELVTA